MSDEELLERKKLQRRRIRGLLIVLNLALLTVLVIEIVNIFKYGWH